MLMLPQSTSLVVPEIKIRHREARTRFVSEKVCMMGTHIKNTGFSTTKHPGICPLHAKRISIMSLYLFRKCLMTTNEKNKWSWQKHEWEP